MDFSKAPRGDAGLIRGDSSGCADSGDWIGHATGEKPLHLAGSRDSRLDV